MPMVPVFAGIMVGTGTAPYGTVPLPVDRYGYLPTYCTVAG